MLATGTAAINNAVALARLLSKPVTEVQDDSGEVAGFGYSQQKTNQVELMQFVNQASATRQHSPPQQNAGDPDARADLMEQQIAGNFQDDIAQEENARREAKLSGGDTQLAVHGEGREPDVDAVYVVHQEERTARAGGEASTCGSCARPEKPRPTPYGRPKSIW